MSAYHVVGIGEILWDFLPTGSQLGGAPCSVAFHANALGDRATILSRIGADALGETAVKLVGKSGVDVSHVQRDPEAPTGTVSVSLNRRGHPNFLITPDVACASGRSLSVRPLRAKPSARSSAPCAPSASWRST